MSQSSKVPSLTPALRVEDNAYYWKDSGPLHRVTSIKSVLANPHLDAWKAKQLATYAVEQHDTWMKILEERGPEEAIKHIKYENKRQLKLASDRGTNVHTYAEALGNGETLPPYVLDMEPRVAHLQRFFAEVKPKIECQELTVFHLTLGYAGRFDAIAHIEGLGRCLIDYKTAKAAQPSYALQMTAYAHAEFIGHVDGTTSEIGDFDAALVVLIREDDYEVVPVDIGSAPWDLFKVALRATNMTLDMDGYVLPPLNLSTLAPFTDRNITKREIHNGVKALDDQAAAELKKWMQKFHIPLVLGDASDLQLRMTQTRLNELASESSIRERVELVIDTPIALRKEMTQHLDEAGIVSTEDQEALMRIVLGFIPKKRLTKVQTQQLFVACQKVAGGEWHLSFGEDGNLVAFYDPATRSQITVAK